MPKSGYLLNINYPYAKLIDLKLEGEREYLIKYLSWYVTLTLGSIKLLT